MSPPPLEGDTLHRFYLSDLVSPLFFVNLPTICFPSGVSPWRMSPGAVRPLTPHPPSDATAPRFVLNRGKHLTLPVLKLAKFPLFYNKNSDGVVIRDHPRSDVLYNFRSVCLSVCLYGMQAKASKNLLSQKMWSSGGLAHRETGRFPGGPLLQEFFRAPGRTCAFISLIIS